MSSNSILYIFLKLAYDPIGMTLNTIINPSLNLIDVMFYLYNKKGDLSVPF